MTTMLLALLGSSSSPSPEVFVSGVSASGAVGFVGSQGSVTFSVAGVSASGQTGSVTQSLGASVNVTGVAATGAVGSADAQQAPLPAGTILLFDRGSEGDPIPSGFSLYTEESGGSIVNYLIKGGTAVSRVTGTAANVSLSPTTLTSSNAGSHDGPTVPVGSAPSPQPQTTLTGGTAGSHSHTITVTAASAPFPVTGSNQGVSVPLIRCASEVLSIPPKCIIFSGTSSGFTNFTRKSWSASLGVYSASSATNINRPSPAALPLSPFAPGLSVSFAGAHSHISPISANFYPFSGPLRNAAATAGSHNNHTVSPTGGGIYVWHQFKHLLPFSSTTEQFVQPGMIVMYNGVSAPAGWKICDGTNDTPDMVNFFLGYNNNESNSNVLVGRNTVGGSFPTATTPAPPPTAFNSTSVPISLATSPWSHSHLGSPVEAPTTRSNFTHGPLTEPHSHSVPSLSVSMPSAYIPAHLTLIFIQKA